MVTPQLSPEEQSHLIIQQFKEMAAELERLCEINAAAKFQLAEKVKKNAVQKKEAVKLRTRLALIRTQYHHLEKEHLILYETLQKSDIQYKLKLKEAEKKASENPSLIEILRHLQRLQKIDASSSADINADSEPKVFMPRAEKESVLPNWKRWKLSSSLVGALLLCTGGLYLTYPSISSTYFSPARAITAAATKLNSADTNLSYSTNNTNNKQPNIYSPKNWFEIAPGWDKVMGEQESESIEDKISSSAVTATSSVVPPLAVSKTEIETQEKITPLTPSTSAGSVSPVNQLPKISSFACPNSISYADREKSLCTLVAEDDYQVDTCKVEYVVSHEGKKNYQTRYLTGPGEQKKTFAFSASLTCDAVGYPCNVEMDAVCYDQQEQKSNGKNRKTVIQAEVEKEVETRGEYQAKVKKDVEAQEGAEVKAEIKVGVKATAEVEPPAGVETKVLTVIDTQKPAITGQCPDKISYQRRQDSICSLVASDNVALSKCEVKYEWSSSGNDRGEIMDTIAGKNQATLDLKLRVKGCPNETIPCELTMHVSCYDVSQNQQDASYNVVLEAKPEEAKP